MIDHNGWLVLWLINVTLFAGSSVNDEACAKLDEIQATN